MKDIDDIRRENIKLLEGRVGSSSAMAKLVGMSDSQYANLRDGAKDSKTGKPRGMRKETAWKFEEAGGEPRGWLDQDHSFSAILKRERQSRSLTELSSNDRYPCKEKPGYVRFDRIDIEATGGSGGEQVYQEVVEELEVLESWARQTLGGDLSRIRLISARGTSMQGTVANGDVLFVDVSVRHYDGDGVYVIVRDGLQVKRLQKLHGNILAINSDNPLFRSEKLGADEAVGVVVCGRVLAAWTLKRVW